MNITARLYLACDRLSDKVTPGEQMKEQPSRIVDFLLACMRYPILAQVRYGGCNSSSTSTRTSYHVGIAGWSWLLLTDLRNWGHGVILAPDQKNLNYQIHRDIFWRAFILSSCVIGHRCFVLSKPRRFVIHISRLIYRHEDSCSVHLLLSTP